MRIIYKGAVSAFLYYGTAGCYNRTDVKHSWQLPSAQWRILSRMTRNYKTTATERRERCCLYKLNTKRCVERGGLPEKKLDGKQPREVKGRRRTHSSIHAASDGMENSNIKNTGYLYEDADCNTMQLQKLSNLSRQETKCQSL